VGLHSETGNQLPEGSELLDVEEDPGQEVREDGELREPALFLLLSDRLADRRLQRSKELTE